MCRSALSLNDKQLQKLDQFIAQINNDMTLRHKIEKINLILTNQKLSPSRNLNEFALLSGTTATADMLSASPSQMSTTATEGSSISLGGGGGGGVLASQEMTTSFNGGQAGSEQTSSSSGGVDAYGGYLSPGLVNYDLVDMLLIDLRKYIAHNVAMWNTRMSEFFKKSKFDDVSLNV